MIDSNMLTMSTYPVVASVWSGSSRRMGEEPVQPSFDSMFLVLGGEFCPSWFGLVSDFVPTGD